MNDKLGSSGGSGAVLLALLGAILAGLAALTILPTALSGQETDGRWGPFTGCWEVVGSEGSVVCVEPGDGPQSVVLRMVGHEGVEPMAIVADGRARDVTPEGCEGTETARFSDDGRRVYIRGEYVCDGGIQQTGSGLLTLVSADEWVDIRVLSQGEEDVVWTQRYVQATPAALNASGATDTPTPRQQLARRLAARAPSLDDVVEVAREVDGRAAAAWLLEAGEPLDVDAEALVAMADAGMDEQLIDVVVAISHPRHFALDVDGEVSRQPRATGQRGFVGGPLAFAPFGFRNRFWGPWGPWGFNSFFDPWFGYGFSPFGWGGGWGGWGGWGGGVWGGYPVVFNTSRIGGSAGGRAIPGRGYTRGTGRRSTPGATSQGYSGPRSSAGSSGRSGGSRSGGARRAKPRGGGSSPSVSRSSAPPRSSASRGRSSTRTRAVRRSGGSFF